MSQNVKNIAILGSTGSIGRNSLEVIKNLGERYRVTYLSARRNIELLQAQISAFHPRGVVLQDETGARELRAKLNGPTEILSGLAGLKEIVSREDVDLVICSLVGFAGLEPTIEAIKSGKMIALANKETLVVAGDIVTRLVRQHGVQLTPIDSEHSAILQCLAGEDYSRIAKLILTASGGPFRTRARSKFRTITIEEALNHPTWRMGSKVTIDSATLMNKGLEVIEAHWLFGLPADRIEVVIHPQSVIHSMVEFIDGSIKAQLGVPDMKLPIQYALTFPDRFPMNGDRVNFAKLHSMTFFEPDRKKFPCLQHAYDALSMGGTAPAVMNAANEIAVAAFLSKKISFQQISDLIGRALASQLVRPASELEQIIEADQATRNLLSSQL